MSTILSEIIGAQTNENKTRKRDIQERVPIRENIKKRLDGNTAELKEQVRQSTKTDIEASTWIMSVILNSCYISSKTKENKIFLTSTVARNEKRTSGVSLSGRNTRRCNNRTKLDQNRVRINERNKLSVRQVLGKQFHNAQWAKRFFPNINECFICSKGKLITSSLNSSQVMSGLCLTRSSQ